MRVRSYRGRRPSSGAPDALRTWGRRWKRAVDRLPSGALESVSFGTTVLIGLVLIWRAGPGSGVAGAAIISLGVIGLLWQSWRWRIRFLDEQARRQRVRIRSERRTARRRRAAEEHDERQKRAAADTLALERAKELQDARRLSANEQAAALERVRRGREAIIAAEATRLLTLRESELMQASIEAFEARGFTVGRGEDEADCDLVLNGPNGRLCGVARRVPHSRRAEALDVGALEAWRKAAGASTSFLIGMAGFTPGAVRLASSLPVTFVEAHLLAQWRFGALEEEVGKEEIKKVEVEKVEVEKEVVGKEEVGKEEVVDRTGASFEQ